MADKKISALTGATTPLAGTEVLPIVQGGSTVKVSVANLTAGRETAASKFAAKIGTSGTYYRLYEIQATGGSAIGEISYNDTNDTMRIANLSNYVNTSMTFYNNAADRMEILPNGNISALTGNVVIGTTAKGITTGSAIPLGLGVNNSVSAVTISTSSNLLVGTTVDAGVLANTQAVTAGKFQTFSGETASLVNGATEDITGLVSGATYLVVCRGSANTTTFVIHTAYVNAAGGVTLAVLSSGNGFVLTSPANNTLRVTSLVSTQTYPYTLTRIF